MSLFKKISALLLLLLLVCLSGCGKQKASGISPEEEAGLKNFAVSYMDQIVNLDDATLDSSIEEFEESQDVVMQNGLNSWRDGRKELGALKGYGEPVVAEQPDGSAKVTLIAEFEKRDCEFIVALNKRRTAVTELTFNPVYSLGEKLRQALVNLAVGMGTVFAVLIFLTWIIGLFRHVNKLEDKLSGKKTQPSQEAVSVPAASEAVQAPADNADDLELQAVIAAAVAAYEEDMNGKAPEKQKKPALTNGIRVQSYRR